jgi:hypothetical protein
VTDSVCLGPLKADAMTTAEKEDLRQRVRSEIGKWEGRGESVLENLGLLSLMAATEKSIEPPYAVMGSTEMDTSVGVVWPIRHYPWFESLSFNYMFPVRGVKAYPDHLVYTCCPGILNFAPVLPIDICCKTPMQFRSAY